MTISPRTCTNARPPPARFEKTENIEIIYGLIHCVLVSPSYTAKNNEALWHDRERTRYLIAYTGYNIKGPGCQVR